MAISKTKNQISKLILHFNFWLLNLTEGNMPRTIEISHRTIVFTVLFVALIWLVLQISSIIMALFVAFLLMTALNPLVDRVSRLGAPRGLAILIVYFLVIGVFVAGLTSVVPPLIEQTTNFVNRAPMLFDQVSVWLGGLGVTVDRGLAAQQVSQLGAIPANLVRFLISLFSNIIGVFTLLVITFYLLLERKNLDRYLLVLFGEGGEKQARGFADKLESRLGGWVRGELMLMTIIGVITYIGLVLLGLPYALPLAIMAGLLEIVPTIGPIISSVPAILLALTVSPVTALATAALYFIVQQAENALIVPKVMQRATGVNPLLTIVALTVGFKLAGVSGAVLAVPVIIVLHLVALEFFSSRRLKALEDNFSDDKK